MNSDYLIFYNVSCLFLINFYIRISQYLRYSAESVDAFGHVSNNQSHLPMLFYPFYWTLVCHCFLSLDGGYCKRFSFLYSIIIFRSNNNYFTKYFILFFFQRHTRTWCLRLTNVLHSKICFELDNFTAPVFIVALQQFHNTYGRRHLTSRIINS